MKSDVFQLIYILLFDIYCYQILIYVVFWYLIAITNSVNLISGDLAGIYSGFHAAGILLMSDGDGISGLAILFAPDGDGISGLAILIHLGLGLWSGADCDGDD